MIAYSVRAVLAVRDGYTGRPVKKNTVRCLLDGQPIAPQFKDGGYLILTDIAAGKHSLLLHSAHFRDEALELDTPEKGWEELSVSLKPGPGYPFGGRFTKLTVSLKKPGTADGRLWIASKSAAMELRQAQDTCSAGDLSLKIYYRGAADTAPLHVPLLIADGPHTEICTLISYKDGAGKLQKALRYGHKRGTRLYPAQTYQFGTDGTIVAAFREPVGLSLFLESNGKTADIELTEGENTAAI